MRSFRGLFFAILLSLVCSVEAFAQFEISETMLPIIVQGKWGFIDRIDKGGKMVIRPRFEEAEDFSEGLARVTEAGTPAR